MDEGRDAAHHLRAPAVAGAGVMFMWRSVTDRAPVRRRYSRSRGDVGVGRQIRSATSLTYSSASFMCSLYSALEAGLSSVSLSRAEACEAPPPAASASTDSCPRLNAPSPWPDTSLRRRLAAHCRTCRARAPRDYRHGARRTWSSLASSRRTNCRTRRSAGRRQRCFSSPRLGCCRACRVLAARSLGEGSRKAPASRCGAASCSGWSPACFRGAMWLGGERLFTTFGIEARSRPALGAGDGDPRALDSAASALRRRHVLSRSDQEAGMAPRSCGRRTSSISALNFVWVPDLAVAAPTAWSEPLYAALRDVPISMR